MSRVDRIAGSDRVKVGLSRRGSRFEKLEKELSHRQGVYNPRGLAAYIGRKKYGKQKFQRLSVYGRRHHVGFDLYVVKHRPREGYADEARGLYEVVEMEGGLRRSHGRFETHGRAIHYMNQQPHPSDCNCPYHGGHKAKIPRILHGIGRGPGPR